MIIPLWRVAHVESNWGVIVEILESATRSTNQRRGRFVKQVSLLRKSSGFSRGAGTSAVSNMRIQMSAVVTYCTVTVVCVC